MTEQKKLHWPAWILILDFTGTILVGLGIYAQVAEGELLFSGFVDLDALAVPMIIIGALMVVPLVFSTISQIRSQP